MDDQVALLLEYLATRKCHRRSLAITEKIDDVRSKATTTTSRAYRESLVKVLTNARRGKDFVDAKTEEEEEEGGMCPLAWLQRILETLVFDSHQACLNEPDSTSANKFGGAYLEDRHVVAAVQALGVQCTSQEAGAATSKLTMSELRAWRALLEGHVVRRAVAASEARRILPWRSRGRVRVSATAIAMFHRIVASLLDPSHVKFWTANDGVQISFRSSCGTFKANYFHFIDDDDDHHTDMPELNEDSGAWIGAVIDCPTAEGKGDQAQLVHSDDDSSLDSDPWCDIDDEDSLSDDENKEGAGFSKRGSDHEMSTASMSSSLSTTSSEASSAATGPATPLLRAGKEHRRRYGDGYRNCGPAKEEPATRRIRLTLQAVLLASVLFRS